MLLGKFYELKERVNTLCKVEFDAVTSKVFNGEDYQTENDSLVKCIQK